MKRIFWDQVLSSLVKITEVSEKHAASVFSTEWSLKYSMSPRKICRLLLDYMVSYPRKKKSSQFESTLPRSSHILEYYYTNYTLSHLAETSM
jgi:hypothetical protein